jgi:hypothetical protein
VLYANGSTERFETRDGTLQSTEYTQLFTPAAEETTGDSGGTTSADNAAEMTDAPPDDLAFQNRMYAQFHNNTEMVELQDAFVRVPYPVQMLRCGSALLADQDRWLAWQPRPGAPGIAVTPWVVFRSTRSMACFHDAGLVQQMAAPSISWFPGEAPGPASLFQNRDGSGVTLLASNRSGDHLAVLHPDGRLELSESDYLATRVKIPKSNAIVPLGGKVITVGPGGETYLDGQPVPADRAINTAVRQRTPALTEDRAAITAEESAVVQDASGVVSRHFSPGHAVDFVRTSQRGTFVASTGYGYFEFEPTSDSGTHPNIPIAGLNDDEAVTDVDVGPDMAFAATDYGRLVVADPKTGRVMRDLVATAPSAEYSLAVSRDGKTIIALGSDGMLTEFDAGSLELLRSAPVGSAARTVRFSQKGDLLVVATADNRVLLVDPDSLETLQVVSDSAPLSYSYVVDSTESTVLGLSGNDPGTAMDQVPINRPK